MQDLINFGSEKKYSSVYLTEQINSFRKKEGVIAELLHKNLLVKIENEFDEDISRLNFKPSTYLAGNGRNEKCYELTFEQSLQVLMSESKTVRKGVISVLKKQQEVINGILMPNFNDPAAAAESWALEYRQKQIAIERAKEAERTVSILTHVSKQYTTTEIAKELGLHSAIELNKLLAEKQIQFNQNGTWVLYSKYSHLGYVDIKQEILDNGKVIYHRRWTQFGREFLVKLLNNKPNE